MRLSILNYGFDLGAEVPKYAAKEDDDLLKIAESVIRDHSFGRGALIVSEVMHTGLTNFNNRKYMEKGMDSSVISFYKPHPTPFLMHHDSGGDFGPPVVSVGSNLHSNFIKRRIETATGPASGYVKVATFIPESAVVGNQNAIELLKSRRLFSLSIGARVADENYVCSICGKSLYDQDCDHISGKLYEGKKCEAHVYNPLFREYSAVYNPSDINALVRRMDVLEGEGSESDKILVVDSYNPEGYAHLYEDFGKSVYNLGRADLNEKAGDEMGNKQPDSSMTDSEVNDLLNKYVKMLGDKDELNRTLSTELGKKIDSEESVKAELISAQEEITKLKEEITALNSKIEGLEVQNKDNESKDKHEESKKEPDVKESKKEEGTEPKSEPEAEKAPAASEPKTDEKVPESEPEKVPKKDSINVAHIVDSAIGSIGGLVR